MLSKTFVFELSRKNVLNINQNKHYHAKARVVKRLRKLAFDTYTADNGGRAYKEPLFDYFRVTITVFAPDRRRLDPPNLYPTVKPLIDGGIKVETDKTDIGCGIWPDDDWSHLSEMTFKYGGVSNIKDTYIFEFLIEEVVKDG